MILKELKIPAIDPGVIAERPPPDLRYLTSAFFAIHIAGGHVGLPILALTSIISKRAKKHPTIINFFVVWIMYSIIYCLLIYGGNAWLDDPPHALCLTQAAMNYAAPPMAVVAGLEVVLQIWSTFMEPWKEAVLAGIPRWLKLVAIISPPYLTFIAFAIPATLIGHEKPHLVRVKNGLYCGLMHGRFEKLAVPVFCGIVLVLIIGFEVASILMYFKRRQMIKRDFPLVVPKKPSLVPWCRACLFLVYATLTLGVCIMDITQISDAFACMVQAALPLAAFLVFGLQKDIILIWTCRNRNAQRRDSECKTTMSGDIPRATRTLSLISTITIESTTPIATHPSSSSMV